MFDIAEMLGTCAREAGHADGQRRVAELARAAVVQEGFGEAVRALVAAGLPDDGTFLRSTTFTALPADVPAGALSPPHDHRMWAVIAVYEGREDNEFYRRGDKGALERVGAASARAREVLELPADTIHTIANAQSVPLRALHLYGGDLIGTSRSVWDAATGEERELNWDALRGRASEVAK